MRNKAAEDLIRYVNYGKSDLEDFQQLVRWSHRFTRLLKWAVDKEWLVPSLFLSMLIDVFRHRKAKIRARMFTHECAILYAPWDNLLESIKKFNTTALAVIDFHLGKQRDLHITGQLADEIIAKYKPLKLLIRSNALYRVPGTYLRYFAEFFFSHKTYLEILEPILRDLFDEYCEALQEHHHLKARWVRIRGYYSFWSAVFAQLPISAVKMAYKIWKATR